ncbi:hypothetical protein [Bacillus mycoides]|uniref:hypothetical protein n=1 Tax=Bacillus mycoides TaxID=1405 RepID=UPI0003E21908|nr:hypothetical protein [Bacillus mycoides]ETT85594.1 hypothetical protein C174_01889 [Bacillus mycoides FSL H7-687]
MILRSEENMHKKNRTIMGFNNLYIKFKVKGDYVKLYEVLIGYEKGLYMDGDVFLYQNNIRMQAMFQFGDLVWFDDQVAVSCKGISRDVWTYKERLKNPARYSS